MGNPLSTGKRNYIGGSLKKSGRLTKTENIPKGRFVAGRDVILDYQIIFGGPPFFNPNTKRFVDYALAVHEGTMKMAPRPASSKARSAAARNTSTFSRIQSRSAWRSRCAQSGMLRFSGDIMGLMQSDKHNVLHVKLDLRLIGNVCSG